MLPYGRNALPHENFELPVLSGAFPGLDKLTKNDLYLMGCGSFDQFCCTLRSIADPVRFCPFCKRELARRGREAESDTKRWMLLANEFPRATKQMWLIVPKHHLVDPAGLQAEDWAEIGRLFELCRIKTGLESGGVVFRFGDPHYNAGTIAHFHVNVIEPLPGTEYRTPLAKTMEKHEQDYLRMLGFMDELKSRGGVDWLFSDAGIQETQPKA